MKYKENFNYYFEILVVDTKGEVVASNASELCLNLMSNGKLFENVIRIGDSLVDSNKHIKVLIKKVNTEKNDKETSEIKQAFTLVISSKKFNSLEAIRLDILYYLKTIKFDAIYVLEDDISMKIADQIYPSIYKVESFLRKYVIKFFAIKLGPEWWQLTAGVDMKKKTFNRKNNETEFSEFIDNEVYLIDFGELGELIYSQSSGNLSKEIIVNKIINIEESVSALINLKKEIQSNYNKFFKSTFKENKFQEKWEELEKLRHKVAHNNLFTRKDEDRASELVGGLIKIIDEANKQIDQVSFNTIDKQYLMRSFIKFNSNSLTKEILLEELEKSINWANTSADGFVGLQSFIFNVMGKKGYDFEETKNLIIILKDEKVLEIYKYFNKEKNEREVAAIRII